MKIERNRTPKFNMILIGIMPSRIKKYMYRKRGYKIGKNVKLAYGAMIEGKNVEIGDNVKIDYATYISGNSIKIGKHSEIGSMVMMNVPEIEIGDYTTIREQVYCGGMTTPKSKLKIGSYVKIFQFTVLNTTDLLEIGNHVGIGGRCSIFTHGSWQSVIEGYPAGFAPVVIKDNAWLPWHVFVMPGVTIGEGSTIGACSLVTKDVPDYALAVGSPAKVIKQKPDYPKSLTDNEKISKMKEIISEMEKYMSFCDLTVKRSEKPGQTILEVSKEKESERIVFLMDAHIDFKQLVQDGAVDIVVNLLCDLPKDFKSSNCIDIKTKTCRYNREFSMEIINFLSRYGIRCNVVEA
jgi:acetyltransferase-like isoleucine patch superfamily enzyme